jgi:protein-tyrosine-phosphatase
VHAGRGEKIYPPQSMRMKMPKDKKKKLRVLFVDDNNDLASQIAEYYTKKAYGDVYEAYSAGPAHDTVDCDLISVMYQEGEDLRRQISKDFRDAENLPQDENYDFVVFFSRKAFDDWSPKTPWKGRQMLIDIGSRADFKASDDAELCQCYSDFASNVKKWVEDNMSDPDRLRSLISA